MSPITQQQRETAILEEHLDRIWKDTQPPVQTWHSDAVPVSKLDTDPDSPQNTSSWERQEQQKEASKARAWVERHSFDSCGASTEASAEVAALVEAARKSAKQAEQAQQEQQGEQEQQQQQQASTSSTSGVKLD